MANPMIELDDRFAIRSSDIHSIDVVGSRIIVNNHAMPRYVLDKPDEVCARDVRNQLLATIKNAESIAPVQATPASGRATQSGATNALNSSPSMFSRDFKNWLKELIDGERFDELGQALDSTCHGFSRD